MQWHFEGVVEEETVAAIASYPRSLTVYSFCGYAGARLGSKSFYDVMMRPSLTSTPGPSTTYTCHGRDRPNSTLSPLPNRLNLLRPKTEVQLRGIFNVHTTRQT
jgi:hypothetical protein